MPTLRSPFGKIFPLRFDSVRFAGVGAGRMGRGAPCSVQGGTFGRHLRAQGSTQEGGICFGKKIVGWSIDWSLALIACLL